MNMATVKIRGWLGMALLAVLGLWPQMAGAQGLSASASNGVVCLSWPAINYYYLVQTNSLLVPEHKGDSNGWGAAGSASLLASLAAGGTAPWFTNSFSYCSNGTFGVTQPLAGGNQFYRLGKPPGIPLFCFVIFYDQLLEFSDCTTLKIQGFTHANGPIYLGAGSGATCTFYSTLTTVGTISAPSNAGFTSWTGTTYLDGNPPSITNISALVSPFGTNDPHVLIEIPPAGELATSALGQVRLFNQAEMVLVVSNSPMGGGPSVSLTLQTSYNGEPPGADPTPLMFNITNATPGMLATNWNIKLSFLQLTNSFTDQREHATNMFVTQIDVGTLGAWLATNTSVAEKLVNSNVTMLYVADRRNQDTNKLAVVRLTNGAKLPYNSGLGFSLATQNPLYVWGDYNTTVDGTLFAKTVGSTTNGATVPAALMADAVTMLSSSWSDAKSSVGYTGRNSVISNMTVNAAMVAGNVPSTGTSAKNYSGGVQNLPRLLENWSYCALTMNTALVCLYRSQMATNQFLMPYTSSGNLSGYYTPPTRNWGIDPNFYDLTKLPPGTPRYYLP
jgi:hypothetical protein